MRRTHGLSKTVEHNAWTGMNKRCGNRKTKSFKDYGDRGIRVCDEWRNSFPTFLRDMGPRPSPMHTIERIDNDGPYEPSNCRWATRQEQNQNKRNVRLVSHAGQAKNLAEWARHYGLQRLVVAKRLKRGWPLDRALTTPNQRARAHG